MCQDQTPHARPGTSKMWTLLQMVPTITTVEVWMASIRGVTLAKIKMHGNTVMCQNATVSCFKN